MFEGGIITNGIISDQVFMQKIVNHISELCKLVLFTVSWVVEVESIRILGLMYIYVRMCVRV